MPKPILLLKKAAELGRQPIASDFTLEERAHLRQSLTSCIRSYDEAGDTAMADRLREHWRRCVRLEEPPKFPVIPKLQEHREGVGLAMRLSKMGAAPMYFLDEDAATD